MAYSENHTSEFWEARFGSPECARHYHYYAYEYLDDLSFMLPALSAFGDWSHAPKLLEEVGAKLKELGWEGTGEFQILWLPPFAAAGVQDNFGVYAIHVKQEEDGISWIVSPVVLPFHRLFQHDDAVYPAPNLPGPDAETRATKRPKGMVRWLKDLLA